VLAKHLSWEKREVSVSTILILDSAGVTAVMAVTVSGVVLIFFYNIGVNFWLI
jgi:uncharacterized membrane protein